VVRGNPRREKSGPARAEGEVSDLELASVGVAPRTLPTHSASTGSDLIPPSLPRRRERHQCLHVIGRHHSALALFVAFAGHIIPQLGSDRDVRARDILACDQSARAACLEVPFPLLLGSVCFDIGPVLHSSSLRPRSTGAPPSYPVHAALTDKHSPDTDGTEK
jgi:hypothetical protein